MNSVFAPPPGSGPVAAPAPVASLADLARLAQDIRDLAAGSVLKGLIVGHDRGGVSYLRLDGGASVVAVRLPQALPNGTAATVELQTRSGQTQVVLLSSKPPQPTPRGAAAPPASPPLPALPRAEIAPNAVPVPARAAALITTAPPLIATVVATRPTTPPEGNRPRTLPDLTPGATIRIRIVALAQAPAPPNGQVPPGTAAPPQAESNAEGISKPFNPVSPHVDRPPEEAPATASPERPAATRQSPPPPATANLVPAPPRLPSAEAVFATMTQQATAPDRSKAAVVAASDTATDRLSRPATLNRAAAASLPATVIATTPAGETIVETPVGRLAMRLPAWLGAPAQAATFSFTLDLPPDAGPRPAALPSTVTETKTDLPALHAAVLHLNRSASPGRQAFMDRLPQPGPKLAAQILAFVAAASRGDAGEFLGKAATDALAHADGGALLSAVDRDFRETSRNTDRHAEWQMWTVPFLHGQGLDQVRFYARRRPTPRSRQQRATDHRFVVECDLSVIGPIQVDGLMQCNESRHSLDIVVRTHANLPSEMRQDLQSLFVASCEAAGLAGRLGFQAVTTFPALLEGARRDSPAVFA